MTIRSGIRSGFREGIREGLNSLGSTPIPTTDDAWDDMFPTITNPVSSYDMTVSASPVVDGIGGDNLVSGSPAPTYGQADVDPAGYGHVEFDAVTERLQAATSGVHNMAATDFSIFWRGAVNDVATNGTILGKNAGSGAYYSVWQLSSGAIRTFIHDGSAASLVDMSPSHSNGEVIDFMMTRNVSTQTLTVHVNGLTAGTSTHSRIAADLTNAALFSICYTGVSPNGAVQSTSACFVFDYVVSAAEFATIRTGLAG